MTGNITHTHTKKRSCVCSLFICIILPQSIWLNIYLFRHVVFLYSTCYIIITNVIDYTAQVCMLYVESNALKLILIYSHVFYISSRKYNYRGLYIWFKYIWNTCRILYSSSADTSNRLPVVDMCFTGSSFFLSHITWHRPKKYQQEKKA